MPSLVNRLQHRRPRRRIVVALVGKRTPRALVAVAVALKDLDYRLQLGVVVAPVRAHIRRRSVRNGHAARAADFFVEHLRIVFDDLADAVVPLHIVVGRREKRHVLNTALGVEHVAVAVGIAHRALVSEQRGKALRQGTDPQPSPSATTSRCGRLRTDGRTEIPIHRDAVDHVAVEVEKRSVGRSPQIHRQFRMAVGYRRAECAVRGPPTRAR